MGYCHRKTLSIPAQVSCLSYIGPRQLLVGSDDGTVRLYSLDTFKVLKAIRGLKSISSVAFHHQSLASRLWVASGRQAHQFSLETNKLVLASSDVLQTLYIGVDDDDNIGELSINVKGTKMAFCTDSGTVGVVDLQTNEITRMKQSHNNVCGSVQFIPDRPSEFVSGGYDCALLHFDFMQGSMLSRDDLSAALPPSGVTLSPPFILCLSVSPTGVIAAGSADGRVYVGTGGEKPSEASGGKQGRQRKWKGLHVDSKVIVDVAEGPIVALAFTGPRQLLICTLLGSLTQYQICESTTGGALKLDPGWQGNSRSYKTNSIAFSEETVIVGGFQKDGTGIIEVWSTC